MLMRRFRGVSRRAGECFRISSPSFGHAGVVRCQIYSCRHVNYAYPLYPLYLSIVSTAAFSQPYAYESAIMRFGVNCLLLVCFPCRASFGLIPTQSSETFTSKGEGNENEPPPSRRREQVQRSRRDKEKDAQTTESAPSDDLGVYRRDSRPSVAEFSDGVGYERRGKRNAVETAEEWDWAEDVGPLGVSPGRYGERGRANSIGNGHPRPTPSYALPTKHFKTLGRCDGVEYPAFPA